jgi:tRNA G18 (ribose-2'-O)-methylase SpoU
VHLVHTHAAYGPIQVAEDALPTYLSQLRQDGYTVLGVEQTAASRSLVDTVFPARTALLLGHELLGIPVHLLDRVDGCVEIPQLGLTRYVDHSHLHRVVARLIRARVCAPGR